MDNLTRRDFLKATAAGAVTAAAGANALAEPKAKRIPIALQLYSVRQEKDIAKVVEALGKMGYDGVEFFGYGGNDYYGKSAQELKKLLDDNGLKCAGTHAGWGTLQGDKLKRTAEYHLAIGTNNLIIPGGLPHGNTVQSWVDAAKKTNEIAAKAKDLGVRVGYHAHAGDFKPIKGQTPWIVYFDNTDPEVIMQLDLGNCKDGGGDPIAILKKYPGRAKTIHLKEHGGEDNAVIGKGAIPWQEVFEICETTGGTEWYVVEQERYPKGKSPLDAAKMCIENLKEMGE